MMALSEGWAQTAALDRVEQLADQGQAREARHTLERWQRDYAESAPPDQRARAWFLAGRLADDGARAELYYLRVVLEGSTSPYADDALRRLAQFRYARGEYAKAIEYLGRLRRDYPMSEHGPTALLWIARSSRALGDLQRACSAVEQGFRELPPTDTLLERSLKEVHASCLKRSGAYSVQVVALKDALAAQHLALRLVADGYDAWVLNASSDSALHRVRVGRGLERREAQAQLERLVAAGYSPFLVSESNRPRR